MDESDNASGIPLVVCRVRLIGIEDEPRVAGSPICHLERGGNNSVPCLWPRELNLVSAELVD